MRLRLILFFLLFTVTESCKTNYSIHEYPRNPEGIIIAGKCLVNEIRTSIPMKKEQKIVETMMSSLQKFIPQVQYAGNDNNIIKLGLPIDPFAHPEILDELHNQYGYDYLIDFQATSFDTQTGSGIAFGSQEFDHQVAVSISVFDTKTQEVLYTQRIELQEIAEEADDEFSEGNKGGFVITRTSENLLKIGIKKCINQFRRSTKQKIISRS